MIFWYWWLLLVSAIEYACTIDPILDAYFVQSLLITFTWQFNAFIHPLRFLLDWRDTTFWRQFYELYYIFTGLRIFYLLPFSSIFPYSVKGFRVTDKSHNLIVIKFTVPFANITSIITFFQCQVTYRVLNLL